LKDRALAAAENDRSRLLLESAEAYRAAAELEPSTYALINAASLLLLAGQGEKAAALAADVIERVEAFPDEPETPYWRAATRAEALLLLDREAEAGAALAEAVALAPRAWEDHASTLRQFALILVEQRREAGWLDPLRPPRSLHFGGHMAFSGERARAGLLREIEEALEQERVGFGYGALAAGADIIVAEALLARGAALHLVLPGGIAAFAARSVDPFGASWRRRFDAVIAHAEEVRPVRPFDAAPEAATISVADEIAMGAALMNARRLESEAVQLLVLDEPSGARKSGAAARAACRWAAGGWRQRLIRAPRDAAAALPQAGDAAEALRPFAVLAIGAEANERLGALRVRLGEGPLPLLSPYWSGDQVLAAWADCAAAGEVAVRLAADGYRVGGDYGVAAAFADPFSQGERLPVTATAAASAAAASTPAGSACVTGDFAAALTAAGPHAPGSELVGELDPVAPGAPLSLYALRPRS
ncbi:MAG: TRAFs-binding domain-containing protein, partial [Allosphingosinicella sp.]